MRLGTVLQPDDPALRADHLNRPARGCVGQPHFLKLYLCGNAVTFQAQPLAQGGETNPVTCGKVLSGQLTSVKTRHQSLPLLRSPASPNQSLFGCNHAAIVAQYRVSD